MVLLRYDLTLLKPDKLLSADALDRGTVKYSFNSI